MVPDNWLPFYPDRLETPARRRDTSPAFLPHASAVYPVPNILASLTFFPRFPDRVPALRLPREGMAAGLVDPLAFSPLVWLPVFPLRVPVIPPRLQGLASDPTFGAGLAIAASLAWQAVYPERVPHLTLFDVGGEAFWVDPSLLGLAPCVHVALDQAAQTGFIAAQLPSTTMLAPSVTTTDLIDEDLC